MARDIVRGMNGVLYTNTYKVAVIIIQLSEDANYDKVLENVTYAINHKGTTYSDMTVTGTLPMQEEIRETSMGQLKLIFPFAILFVAIVLLIFHRNIKAVLIALVPTAYAITLTFGVLGTVEPKLTIISAAVVALLLGLGVDYSIHLMNRYAEEHNTKDKIERMEKILSSTGKAVLLSTITTVIGFGSLMISSMHPMVVFGFACAIGILFCFVSAMVLVPCLCLILKFEKMGRLPNWKKFATFSTKNKKRILVIAIFFAIMSIILLPQTETDVNYFDMAPEGISTIEKLLEYSDNFGGGMNFNALLVETDQQGLTDPEAIDAIYEMELKLRDLGINAYSVVDEVKKIKDIIGRNDLVEILSGYIGVDQVIYDRIAKEGLINHDFSKTVVFISIPVGMSIAELEVIVNEINSIAFNTVLPHNGKVSQLTGQDAINVAINNKLVDEQTRSMIIAILLVLAALIIIFNSSIYGFLTMIPVGFVLIWEIGFLVAFDIPLNVITISIASIMIGIGIDYSIHITHRVREEMAKGLPKSEATREAIEKTGLSLIEAALTTIAGISSIFLINILALQQFGLVLVAMTAFSCIGAALILPAFYDFKFVK